MNDNASRAQLLAAAQHPKAWALLPAAALAKPAPAYECSTSRRTSKTS